MKQFILRKALPLALVLAAVGFASGCDLKVDLDIPLPPHEPRLVVNALFETDQRLRVDLGRSLETGHAGNTRIVENGRVTLYMDGLFVEELQRVAPDEDYFIGPSPSVHYVSSHRMQPERTYRIEAEGGGLRPVSAEERTLPLASFEVVSISPGPTTPGGDQEDQVVLRIFDAPGPNYYHLSFPAYWRPPGSVGPPQFQPLAFRSDDPVLQDGQFFDLFDVGARRYTHAVMFSDAAFDGEAYTLTLYVRSLSDRHGGAHDPFVRLDALSEQYYRYSRARQALWDNQGNPFAEPIILPSNVTGGLGIFAGRSGRDVPLPPH